MIEGLFGNYLMETGRISVGQYRQVIEKMDIDRPKIGKMAVMRGYMTEKQAVYVNACQKKVDKRFGDIAVEKGYLTQDQIGELIRIQGNAYLCFIQNLQKLGFMKMSDAEAALDEYQAQMGFTDSQMEDFRSNEPERITPLMLPSDYVCERKLTAVMLRFLIRFADRHAYLKPARYDESMPVRNGVIEMVDSFTGKSATIREIVTGITDSGKQLDKLAVFLGNGEIQGNATKNTMTHPKEQNLGNLLSCVNATYLKKLENSGIRAQIQKPVYTDAEFVLSRKRIWRVPFCIHEGTMHFYISVQKNNEP